MRQDAEPAEPQQVTTHTYARTRAPAHGIWLVGKRSATFGRFGTFGGRTKCEPMGLRATMALASFFWSLDSFVIFLALLLGGTFFQRIVSQ